MQKEKWWHVTRNDNCTCVEAVYVEKTNDYIVWVCHGEEVRKQPKTGLNHYYCDNLDKAIERLREMIECK
jgi:hypothetical protein